jgi:hypothetical protein
LADGEGEGLGVADALGAGCATGIKVPLSQTNFLPLFTHVYVLPAATLLIPALVQELPDFTAAYEFEATITTGIIRATRRKYFFIPRG